MESSERPQLAHRKMSPVVVIPLVIVAVAVGLVAHLLLDSLAPDLGPTSTTVFIAVLAGLAPAPLIWKMVIEPMERRFTETSLAWAEAQTRFRHLFEEMGCGVIVYEPLANAGDFRIKDLNKAASSLLDTPREQLLEETVRGVFPTLEDTGVLDMYRKVLAKGQPAKHPPTLLENEGRSLWLERKAYPLPTGELVSIIDDVSEWMRSQEAIRTSEANYRHVVENSHDSIAVVQDGYVTFANGKTTEMTGYSMDELLATPWTDLVVPEDKEALVSRYEATTAGRGRKPETYKFRIRAKGGDILWLENRAVLFEWQDRPATLNFLRDVTEQLELERRFLQSQKMEAVGTLAAGVAHDFNNFLTLVQGNAALIENDAPPGSPLLPLVEEISEASDSAASLTRQLLAFSRKQTLRPKTLDVNALLADLSKMLRRLLGEDVDLLFAPGGGLGKVTVDPGQLEQVIVNLAVNARDAMPDGGKLTLETSNVTLDSHYVAAHPEAQMGDHVMISVTDSGVGIPEEKKPLVFEPFFTTKEKGKGTGLGLSTVFGIVKQSGGSVELYSEVGEGTTFRIYLPRAEGTAETDEEQVDAPRISELPGGTETVLLVEDSPAVRGLARRTLELGGYTVLEAAGGTEALLLCERYSGPIHLLLTDVVMPEMDGRVVADHILGARPEAVALFMSGYTDDAIIHRGVLEPGVELLEKPFGPREILPKVREMLDGGPARGGDGPGRGAAAKG